MKKVIILFTILFLTVFPLFSQGHHNDRHHSNIPLCTIENCDITWTRDYYKNQ